MAIKTEIQITPQQKPQLKYPVLRRNRHSGVVYVFIAPCVGIRLASPNHLHLPLGEKATLTAPADDEIVYEKCSITLTSED